MWAEIVLGAHLVFLSFSSCDLFEHLEGSQGHRREGADEGDRIIGGSSPEVSMAAVLQGFKPHPTGMEASNAITKPKCGRFGSASMLKWLFLTGILTWLRLEAAVGCAVSVLQ